MHWMHNIKEPNLDTMYYSFDAASNLLSDDATIDTYPSHEIQHTFEKLLILSINNWLESFQLKYDIQETKAKKGSGSIDFSGISAILLVFIIALSRESKTQFSQTIGVYQV